MGAIQSENGPAGLLGRSPFIYAMIGVVLFAVSLTAYILSPTVFLVVISTVSQTDPGDLQTYTYVLQPLFLSNLRSFPGPAAAKVSSFWLTTQCRRTRRSEAVMELHRKHGDFVRIAPNSISINDPSAVQQVYSHKSSFAKGDFYDAFLQVRPVVFNARNVALHQKKRKYMNPAFSARALSEFERYMDADLLLWKKKLLAMTQQTKSANLDFAVWSE